MDQKYIVDYEAIFVGEAVIQTDDKSKILGILKSLEDSPNFKELKIKQINVLLEN